MYHVLAVWLHTSSPFSKEWREAFLTILWYTGTNILGERYARIDGWFQSLYYGFEFSILYVVVHLFWCMGVWVFWIIDMRQYCSYISESIFFVCGRISWYGCEDRNQFLRLDRPLLLEKNIYKTYSLQRYPPYEYHHQNSYDCIWEWVFPEYWLYLKKKSFIHEGQYIWSSMKSKNSSSCTPTER